MRGWDMNYGDRCYLEKFEEKKKTFQFPSFPMQVTSRHRYDSNLQRLVLHSNKLRGECLLDGEERLF